MSNLFSGIQACRRALVFQIQIQPHTKVAGAILAAIPSTTNNRCAFKRLIHAQLTIPHCAPKGACVLA